MRIYIIRVDFRQIWKSQFIKALTFRYLIRHWYIDMRVTFQLKRYTFATLPLRLISRFLLSECYVDAIGFIFPWDGQLHRAKFPAFMNDYIRGYSALWCLTTLHFGHIIVSKMGREIRCQSRNC